MKDPAVTSQNAHAAGDQYEDAAIATEDSLRAQIYQLLAAALAAPPSDELLNSLGALDGDGSPLGRAFVRCAETARATDAAAEDDAYHTLFIGIGAGEFVPFGSYYLTGFLHEKPLARLRQDMAALGVEQDPDVKEPEDHIASLMELMAGLIEGRFGDRPATLGAQQKFYDAHVGNWAPQFFQDLSGNSQSDFYAAIGQLGAAFLSVEAQSFEYA